MPDRPRPEDLVGNALPDLTLPDPGGAPYPLRQHVGRSPLVLFFYIKNGTPG
jgi:peroxiredoxin